eukprot:3951374-Amphidinium_carterae.1
MGFPHFQVSSRHLGRRPTSCSSSSSSTHSTLFWNGRPGRGAIPPGLLEGKDRGDAEADKEPHVEFGLMDDDVNDAAEQLPQAKAKAAPTQAQRLLALRLRYGHAAASDKKAAAEL